jgi:hypothetical protein
MPRRIGNWCGHQSGDVSGPATRGKEAAPSAAGGAAVAYRVRLTAALRRPRRPLVLSMPRGQRGGRWVHLRAGAEGIHLGLAPTIIVGQVPKLYGVPGDEGDFFERLAGFLGDPGDCRSGCRRSTRSSRARPPGGGALLSGRQPEESAARRGRRGGDRGDRLVVRRPGERARWRSSSQAVVTRRTRRCCSFASLDGHLSRNPPMSDEFTRSRRSLPP